MNTEQLHLLALHLTPGIGPVLARQLITYCGSAEAIFKRSKGQKQKIPGIGAQTLKKLSTEEYLTKALQVGQAAREQNLRLYFLTDSDYPVRLKQLPDAPLVLFYKGTTDLNARRIVSIVGTRQATEYGKHVTEELIKQLAPYHPIIVSGLAYGIDIQAHRAALQHQLPTLAVFACGLDTIYPQVHKETVKVILENGGIISEQIPGTGPDSYLFPVRNRIIAGLADATIVVEATRKGGAIITAKLAFDYDREVFAVPGDLNKKYSEGCNELIRNHVAQICTNGRDIAQQLNWSEPEKNEENKQRQLSLDLSTFQAEEKAILETLLSYQNGLPIDELSFKSQVSMNKAASVLLKLEFEGLIRALPGKRFKLCK